MAFNDLVITAIASIAAPFYPYFITVYFSRRDALSPIMEKKVNLNAAII